MDGSQSAGSGFPPHIQGQLREAAMSVTNPQAGRGRGQNQRARGNFYPNNQQYHQPHLQHSPQPNPRGGGHYTYGQPHPQQTRSPWEGQLMVNPTDTNSFPPLGATRPLPPTRVAQHPQNTNVQQMANQTHSQTPVPSQQSSTTTNPSYNSRGAYKRGRGGFNRGRGNHYNSNNQQNQGHGPIQVQSTDEFRRPPPAQRNLFTNNQPQFNNIEDQRAHRKKIMDQSDFLNHLANQALKNQLTPEEQQTKEQFRKLLETIAQTAISTLKTEEMKFDPKHIQLKLYGSLGSGFGVAGSDMDLLLAFPQNEGDLGDIEIVSRRLLEKALLDAGIGARLLENTRVPILRICEKPSPELLKNLREYRLKWEESPEDNAPPAVDEGFGALPILTDAQEATAATALANLDLQAHDVPLPASPQLESAKLEFTGDCGIQCDINFSNYVALHNTRLLRTYGMCDPRVRQVGVFVKLWAKARDINTPYRGTLSSYGYILMVLHYLMHVASPPVLPNLQEIAKHKDSWNAQSEVKLVEGFDVRFIQNMDEVQAIVRDMPRNHESVGSLLRGFFWYFSDPRGFHWNYDAISIRSRTGRITKKSKGWTEAKWSAANQNVRLRYLLAIEDPFEIEHNIARTVGHSGIVAIRDEFRQAWTTIENINYNQDNGLWYYLSKEGDIVRGDSMMSVIENRGDLLRKDQDYHRQKARQMRQELEAKEKALREAAAQETEGQEETETNGMSEMQSRSVAEDLSPSPSAPVLIDNDGFQAQQNPPEIWENSPTQNYDTEKQLETQFVTTKIIDWSQPLTDAELGINREKADSVRNEEVQSESVVWAQPQPTIDDQFNVAVEEKEAEQEFQSENAMITDQAGEENFQIVIPWAIKSRAGRWLRWRDRQIVLGRWKEKFQTNIGRAHQRLDEKFPYDPDMSVTELVKKNQVLLTQYLYGIAPRIAKEPNSSDVTEPSPKVDKAVSKAAESYDQHHQPKSRPAVSWFSDSCIDKYSYKISTEPSDTSAISTNHVSKAPRHNQTAKRSRVVKKDDDSDESRDEEPAEIATKSTVEISPSADKLGESRSNENTGMRTAQSTTSSVAEEARIQEVSLPNTENQNERVQESSSPTVMKQPTDDAKIALLKLFKNDVSLDQEADNHTNLGLSPSQPDFPLDSRQLADIEVIQRGGNGCARSQIGVKE